MKNTEIYTDEYGMKTTQKLNKIIDAARKHVAIRFYNRKTDIMFSDFCAQKRMLDLRKRFDAEAERISVNYSFGDCLA